MNFQNSIKKVIVVNSFLFLLLIIFAVISISSGSVNISFFDVIKVFFNPDSVDESIKSIVLELRLPRTIIAILVGAGLAINGTIFQALLKNPLAEPYILGISGGSALGSLVSVALGLSFFWMQTFSFLGAIFVALLVFTLSLKFGEIDLTRMILSGVMMSSFISSAILLIVTFSDQTFRLAIFWLIGNLSMAEKNMIFLILPVLIMVFILGLSFGHSFNLISISEETAKQFGINVKVVKNLSYFSASLLTSFIVSAVGIIGFVGLLIPHFCRLLFGNDNKILIPTSFFMGAIFLIICDFISRIAFSPIEIPIGAITAILGAPLFIFLLRYKMKDIS